ncbi:hypothetical protein DESACE_09300 [Desulfurella acetivorans A63]|nr:hypothetical protein DESACE_09300 [Desulfurella acetivorans A63]
MNTVLKSVISFAKNDGFLIASSLSFYFILALVPFLLFLSSILIFLVSSSTHYYNFIIQKITLIFPVMLKGTILSIIKPLIHKKISYFSLILYAITSLSYFYMLDAYINKIFNFNKKRSILDLFFVYIMLIGIAMVLIVAYLGGLFLPFEFVDVMFRNVIKHFLLVDFIGIYIVPFLSLFIIAFLLYKFLPRNKVSVKNAMKGAFFFALVLEILKRLFIIYVKNIGKLNFIYGAFWGYIAFLVWVYLLFCVFLIGAHIVHNLEQTS